MAGSPAIRIAIASRFVIENMDLINDLGTELALAFLVERRFRQKIDSQKALALISQVRRLLESELGDAHHAPVLSMREPFHNSSAH